MKRSDRLLATVATGTVLCLAAVAVWTVSRRAEPTREAALEQRALRSPVPEPMRVEALAAPSAAPPTARASEEPSAASIASEPLPAPAPTRQRALVAGRVVDTDGRPLADVRVEVRLAESGTELARGSSDGGGAFAIELELRGEGYERAKWDGFHRERGNDEVETLVAQLASLGYGDVDRSEVAQALARGSRLARLWSEVTGSASPPAPRVGRVELEVRASTLGFVPNAVRLALETTGERRGLELVLAPGGFVVGTVHPPHAEVWLIDASGAIRAAARADRGGRYLLGFPSAGEHHVFARFVGIGHAWQAGLALSPLVSSTLEPLTLAGSGTIQGSVVYAGGRSASGVEVEAVPFALPAVMPTDAPWNDAVARSLDELGFFRGRAVTNERGAFRMQGLQPGRYRVTLPEVVHGVRPLVEATTGGAPVELVYDGARLLVDVVLADGEEGPLEVRCELDSENGLGAPDRRGSRTIDGAAGRVVFDVIPGGTYRVEARGPGGTRAVHTLFMVELEQTLELVLVSGRERLHDEGDGRSPPALLRVRMLDLDARAQPAAVRGLVLTLRDADGRPAVEPWPVDRGWLEVPPGTFGIELAAGDGFWIEQPLLIAPTGARVEDGPDDSVTLRAGDVRTLTLHGRQGGRIALDVQGAEDLLAEPLRILAVGAEGAGHELARDPQGRLDALAPGTYTLHVGTPSSEPTRCEVRVVARETVALEVALRRKQPAAISDG